MTNDFRVLVTGARQTTEWHDRYVERILAALQVQDSVVFGVRRMVVIQGECPTGGVDLAAKRWALDTHGVINESHPADWEKFKQGAGPIRNSQMVAAGADICLALPIKGSRGTWDCLRKAVDAGIPAQLHPLHIVTLQGP